MRTQDDFAIIWQNFTFRIDTRSWLQYCKGMIFSSNEVSLDHETRAQVQKDLCLNRAHAYLSSDKRGYKIVLDNVCGSLKSGQLTGILGSSGAGKSSLLNCLFRGQTQGCSGRIVVQNFNKHKLHVSFIPQKDHMNEYLTVREDLTYVSKLRSVRVSEHSNNHASRADQFDRSQRASTRRLIDKSATFVPDYDDSLPSPNCDHNANVLHIAELLGITSCLDVLVRNISSGQRKRLSIARELMSEPDVLVLDEPTTGLDAVVCSKTMKILRNLAHCSPYPIAVVCTIHSPPEFVFQLFDTTYFLSSQGQAVYEGAPASLSKTLSDITGVQSNQTNSDQKLVDMCTDITDCFSVENLVNHQRDKFARTYSSDQLSRLAGLHESSDTSNASAGTNKYYITPKLKHDTKLFNFRQVAQLTTILARRHSCELYRNTGLIWARLAFHVGLPLAALYIFGTASSQTNCCPDVEDKFDPSHVAESLSDAKIKKKFDEVKFVIENIVFISLLVYGYAIHIVSVAASSFPQTVDMFRKEISNGVYSPGSYFFGKCLAEAPQEIVLPFFSMLLVYNMSNQASSYLEWRMIATAAHFAMCCYCVHVVGLLCGTVFIMSATVAIMAGQFVLLPAILVAGFVVNKETFYPLVQTLMNIGFFRPSMKAIVSTRYGFNICQCDDETLKASTSLLANNVKHVLDYILPQAGLDDIRASEVVDRLIGKLAMTRALGVDIRSCADARPYVLKYFHISDDDLHDAAIWYMIAISVVLTLTYLIFKHWTVV